MPFGSPQGRCVFFCARARVFTAKTLLQYDVLSFVLSFRGLGRSRPNAWSWPFFNSTHELRVSTRDFADPAPISSCSPPAAPPPQKGLFWEQHLTRPSRRSPTYQLSGIIIGCTLDIVTVTPTAGCGLERLLEVGLFPAPIYLSFFHPSSLLLSLCNVLSCSLQAELSDWVPALLWVHWAGMWQESLDQGNFTLFNFFPGC